MPVILFCLVITLLLFVIIYGVLWYKENNKSTIIVNPYDVIRLNRKRIIEFVYKQTNKMKKANMKTEVTKISILEKLNITPELMNKCLKELTQDKLINMSENLISLTSFGAQYYEVFIKSNKRVRK